MSYEDRLISINEQTSGVVTIPQPLETVEVHKHETDNELIAKLAVELYKASNFDINDDNPEDIAKRTIIRAQSFWKALPNKYKDALLKK